VQKFTRPITREVELGGERLAFTFTEQGLQVRPLGSRKPPREITWGAVLVHMLGSGEAAPPAPSADQVTAAAASLKGPGSKSAPKPPAEPAHAEAESSSPSSSPPSSQEPSP
jgi:hypothetical protein